MIARIRKSSDFLRDHIWDIFNFKYQLPTYIFTFDSCVWQPDINYLLYTGIPERKNIDLLRTIQKSL